MFTLIIYTGYVIEPNVTRTVGRPYDYPFYIDYLLTFQSIKLLFVYTTVTNFYEIGNLFINDHDDGNFSVY